MTEYESKIYLSLMKEQPANGNMIALSSGVPGPKVYESLKKMTDKGYVYLISEEGKSATKKYCPLPYEDLLVLFKQSFMEDFTLLNTELKEITQHKTDTAIKLFHIDGYATSIQAINAEIGEAIEKIYFSGWSKDLTKIYKKLMAAHRRGVKIISLLYDESELEIPWLNIKHFQVELSDIRHGMEMNVVIDERCAIVFSTSHEDGYAVISRHLAMIKTTRSYIRHDIYINVVLHDFDDLLVEKYGLQLEGLLNPF